MANERTSSRWRGRRSASAAAAAIAVTTATLTGPAASAGPDRHDAELQPGRPQPAGQVRDKVVTLVTGDRIRVTEDGDSPHSFELLRGSPSYGRTPLIFGSAESTYVIPRMSQAARDRLGYSMFDVTALADAQRSGAVPLEVRFEPGTSAHDVAGIDVEKGSVRRTAAGSSVADASYLAGEARTDPATWRGVANVRLAHGSDRAATSDGGRKHRLTIRVKNRAGDPVKRAEAWVQNLDDGRLFNKPVKVEKGRASVSVPKGSYSVMAYRGRYLAGNPELVVADARTVRLDLSDASVGYDVTVDGARPNKGPFGDMLMLRRSEKHGRFGIVGDRSTRLQPMPGPVSHGRFDTQVAGYFVRGERKRDPNVFTMDLARGVPEDLTFHHDRSEFARIPFRIHSDGSLRQGRGFGTLIRHDVVGRGRGMPENTGWTRAVDTPARYTFWLQAGERATWTQEMSVFDDDSNLIGLQLDGSYEPGRVEPVHYLRGPVGPGLERGIDGDGAGRRCLLCREGNQLRGHLPVLSGAGSGNGRTLVTRRMGSWQLRHKQKVLQRGRAEITPKLDLPAKKRRYTLRATSRLGELGWRLSPRVDTSWGFASRKRTGVVPLLMPSYIPAVTLKGRAHRGPMTYRLDLENLGPVESRITKASLRYSMNDGKAWHKARLRRLDKNSFRVRYRNPPAGDAHRYVSLRVRARDAGGRTVQETATRAYRLRQGDGQRR